MKCCDLTSGMLRHKITIERESQVQDNVGGYSSSWSTLSQPFAFIKPMSGNERFWANRLESNLTHRIFLRYITDITTKDRIIYDGREFQIRAIINVEERDKWLELHCVEGQVN